MTLAEKMRFQRLRRIHAKFLKGAERRGGLYHLVCRSDSETLREILAPSWLDGFEESAKSTLCFAEWEKLNEHFWGEAFTYGRYTAVCEGGFASTAHVVWIRGQMWSSRYAGGDEPEDAEAESDEGEFFGESRLLETLAAHRHLPVAGLLDAIVRTVVQFSGREQEDDLTLVVARAR